MTTILQFYGNHESTAYLFTDNQAAEHVATKPTMNEHSRSIDIRHHAVRQDYIAGKVQIRGVKTTDNPSDILTKFLPAPTHMKHTSPLNINFPATPPDNTPTPTLTPQATTLYTQMATTSSTKPTQTSKQNTPHTVGPTPHTRLGVDTSSRRGGCGTVVRVSACANPPLTFTVNGLASHPPTKREY
jgi:hypothetical protein